jgi:hypothetical protein
MWENMEPGSRSAGSGEDGTPKAFGRVSKGNG